MEVFLVGTGLFVIAFLIHVAVWNFRVPRRQATTLLLVFVTVGTAGALGHWTYNGSGGLTLAPLRVALSLLFYFSACAIYFLLFSAIEVDSPTMTLIGIIRRNGARGTSREQLMQEMAGRPLVRPRLDQMIYNGI